MDCSLYETGFFIRQNLNSIKSGCEMIIQLNSIRICARIIDWQARARRRSHLKVALSFERKLFITILCVWSHVFIYLRKLDRSLRCQNAWSVGCGNGTRKKSGFRKQERNYRIAHSYIPARLLLFRIPDVRLPKQLSNRRATFSSCAKKIVLEVNKKLM